MCCSPGRRSATLRAARTTEPLLTPAKMPSFSARSRVKAKLVWLSTTIFPVEDGLVEDLGEEAFFEGTQALNVVAGVGGGGDDANIGVAGFEAAAGAGERSARAEPSHEDGDLGEVAQDLDGGAVLMGGGVGFVAVLVGEVVAVGVGGDDLLGLDDGAVGAELAGGVDDLGAGGSGAGGSAPRLRSRA